MNEPTRRSHRRKPWWRRRWLVLSAAAALLQFGFFWLISLRGDMGSPVPTRARHAFLADPASGPLDEWLWLLHPGRLLLPSPDDFSSAAWLEAAPLQVTFEELTVRRQPLPFIPISATASRPGILARIDPAPALRWSIPQAVPGLPEVVPVPLTGRLAFRVVEGLTGWRWVPPGPAPESTFPVPGGPVSIRLALGTDGLLATPAVVWEGSGIPAQDEAALAWVERGRFVRESDEPERSSTGGLDWGLVAVEWGRAMAPPKAP